MTDSDTGTGADASSTTDSDRSLLRETVSSVGEMVDTLEFEAAIAGGLAGGFQAALVIQIHDTDAIRRVGSVFGAPTLNGGWISMFALGVLFALPFSVLVSSTIDSFVSKLMMLSSRNNYLRNLLVPLLKRSALTTTTLGLGTGYGLGIGVVFSLFVMPVWLTFVIGVPTAIPFLTSGGLFGVLGWTLYGGTLGLVYGLILEY